MKSKLPFSLNQSFLITFTKDIHLQIAKNC